MVRVCESNIIFPRVRRPSICRSRYLLLSHWAEFNQTCYITSPHGWGVRKQHYFSVCPSILSVTLSLPKPLDGIQPNLLHHITSPYGKSVREQHFFVRPSSVHLSVTLSPPKPLGGIQPNLLHPFPSWYECARATIFFHTSVVRPSVCHAISP